MVSGLKPISKNNKKYVKNNSNTTIDALHTEKINYFKKLKNSLPTLKKNLKLLIDEYNSKNNNTNKNDIDTIFHRDNLKEKIIELKNKINSIYNDDEMNKYYLNVGCLLHNYYQNIENTKNNLHVEKNNNFENNHSNNITKKNNILMFFKEEDTLNSNENVDENNNDENNDDENNNNDENDDENDNIKINVKETNIETNKNNGYFMSLKINNFVKEESIFKKKDILDEYLQKIDSTDVLKIKFDDNIYKCPNCNVEMVIYHYDGIQICEKCGYQQNILIESDKPSFKDPPMEVCYFTYKRINHFNEWLAQFQAKETTEIPPEVYEKILLEIKKERIVKLDKLDTKKIRYYLKKVGLNKYYDHSAHILYQINGIQPPSMTKELEEILRLMFKKIQGPFMEVCPKSRKNFLNYSFIIHKFVELLGLDEYKVYFPLLKDREKLYQTDLIWKKMCHILSWHYIKSI